MAIDDARGAIWPASTRRDAGRARELLDNLNAQSACTTARGCAARRAASKEIAHRQAAHAPHAHAKQRRNHLNGRVADRARMPSRGRASFGPETFTPALARGGVSQGSADGGRCLGYQLRCERQSASFALAGPMSAFEYKFVCANAFRPPPTTLCCCCYCCCPRATRRPPLCRCALALAAPK